MTRLSRLEAMLNAQGEQLRAQTEALEAQRLRLDAQAGEIGALRGERDRIMATLAARPRPTLPPADAPIVTNAGGRASQC